MTVIARETASHEALTRRIRQLEKELAKSQDRRRHRREIAAQVHQSLLPRPVRHQRIHVDVRYVPIDEVGGDYCQVRFPDATTCYLTMVDVMGHGVGPALLATRISSEVRYAVMSKREPRQIVHLLDEFMSEFFGESELFLTFVVARIDLITQKLTWSGAGHPAPLWLRDDKATSLTSQNQVIGLGPQDLRRVGQDSVTLAPRDRVILFTDGLFEVSNHAGQQLGLEGYTRLVESLGDCDVFAVADEILASVQAYRQRGHMDDQTLVVAELQ